MKISFHSSPPRLAMAALLMLGALALPGTASAKPDKKGNSSSHDRKPDKKQDYRRSSRDSRSGSGYDRDSWSGGGYDRDDDRGRTHYHSRPRSSFTLNFGLGYAGRGYYYGPPGESYYYHRPEVRYYRTRELAPREYQGYDYRAMSVGASVQQALARRGYYRGGIDGHIGPYSRQSIALYQADHGLRPTGLITSSLLRSLGLE